jgi:hypothetical protein
MTRAKSKPPREVWAIFNETTGGLLISHVSADKHVIEYTIETLKDDVSGNRVPVRYVLAEQPPAKRQRGKR